MRTRSAASPTSQIVNIRIEQRTLDREVKLRETLQSGNRSDTLRRCIVEGMKVLERQQADKREHSEEDAKIVEMVAQRI